MENASLDHHWCSLLTWDTEPQTFPSSFVLTKCSFIRSIWVHLIFFLKKAEMTPEKKSAKWSVVWWSQWVTAHQQIFDMGIKGQQMKWVGDMLNKTKWLSFLMGSIFLKCYHCCQVVFTYKMMLRSSSPSLCAFAWVPATKVLFPQNSCHAAWNGTTPAHD